MNRKVICILFVTLLAACASGTTAEAPTIPPPTATTAVPAPVTETASATPVQTGIPGSLVPNFEHIVIIVFENKEFGRVIDNPDMPIYNGLADEYTLLSQFYGVTHPSLPNYIAMMAGDTLGIDRNCSRCFVDAPSLPDLIEASGRTWKTYQEDMPSPCYVGSKGDYAQKHNPFIYFDSIRLDTPRCEEKVVPLSQLAADVLAGTLPNFIFITPNMCNSGHDCSLDVSDGWLGTLLTGLVPALELQGSEYLIVLTWDEGQGDHSCCGLPEKAGGRIAVVLISPRAKNGFEDPTPYTHYSLLKTISNAWGLPYLGHAAEDNHELILAPWE